MCLQVITSIAAAAMFWGDFISLCHFGKGEGKGEGEGMEDHQGVGLVWDWAEVLAGEHKYCGGGYVLGLLYLCVTLGKVREKVRVRVWKIIRVLG